MAEIKQIKLPNGTIYDIVDNGAVRYDKDQSLTESQQQQGRENMSATKVTLTRHI